MVCVFTFSSILYIIEVKGAAATLDPALGKAPIIDGIIDGNINEWEEFTPVSIQLYQNISNPQNGLPIDIKSLQNGTDLFICIQFELEPEDFKDDEFLGILVSKTQSEAEEDFFDAKIVQFSNITTGDFEFKDYYINNSIFIEDNDTIINGNGAANLTNNKMTYEFSLPLRDYPDDPDAPVYDQVIEGQTTYAFKIIFGNTPLYPEGISHQNIILINVKYPSEEDNLLDIDLIYLILTIIIFSFVFLIFGFQVYKITSLKSKIKRIRG
jgi:hypothetical protein